MYLDLCLQVYTVQVVRYQQVRRNNRRDIYQRHSIHMQVHLSYSLSVKLLIAVIVERVERESTVLRER